jgi:uncharacterized membrane protein
MSRKKKKKTHNKKAIKNAEMKKPTYNKTAAKKAAVLGTEKKSRLPLFALIAAPLILGVAYYYYMAGTGKETIAVSSQTVSSGLTSQVTYPASTFDDGNARHFQYSSNGVTIKYFILKSSDGVIRAAYDACDVCWPAGKGYYQAGDNMVCRNCGRKFASVLVNVVQGGCNPAPLKRKIENGNLVIQINDILDGKQYFNFGKV